MGNPPSRSHTRDRSRGEETPGAAEQRGGIIRIVTSVVNAPSGRETRPEMPIDGLPGLC